MKCPLQGKPFYCREWIFAKISHYLNSQCNNPGKDFCAKNSNSGILVTGGPGSGKTAICCELTWPSAVISPQAELNARLVAFHFCQRFDAASLEPVGFIRSIVDQLAESPLIPDFAQKIKSDPNLRSWLDPAKCKLFPRESFRITVLDTLSTVLPPQETLIVLIDSLHEIFDHSSVAHFSSVSNSNRNKLATNEDVTVLDLISDAAGGLPPWIMLLCTSRRGCRPVTQTLNGFKKITLDDLRRTYAVRDIQQYILARLDGEDSLCSQLDSETADMLNQLHIKSAGCLLYLELVLDGVKSGFIRMREIQHMPGTLNGLYLWLCQRMFTRGHSFASVRGIVEILLAVREPLTVGELEDIVLCQNRMKRKELHQAMRTLGSLLEEIELEKTDLQDAKYSSGKRKCVIIFHPSFAEWLLDVKYCTQKYKCDPSEGHGFLAHWYASRGSELSCEEVICFAYHLTKCPSKTPFSNVQLADWLVQSGAPVQDLVLNCSVIDEPTTRLLLDAGADFVSLGFDDAEINANFDYKSRLQHDFKLYGLPETSGTPDSENSSVRSENEILVDESLDAEGRTVLHHASNEGRLSSVRRLLARGAYCDPEDRHGDTPLCLAAKQGHWSVVQSLLQCKADPNHLGQEGWTPLRSAARGGSTMEQVRCFDRKWAGGPCQRSAEVGASPQTSSGDQSHSLAEEETKPRNDLKHLETVKQLLMHGAEVDFTGEDKRTPLRAAAWAGNISVVYLLLEAGAEVDKIDPEGRTALMASAYMGHKDIVDLLMRWGADPNHADLDGRTALSVTAVCASASAGHEEVAESLLNGGANIDCRDTSGRTPLFTAALEGHQAMCELLVGFGADLDLTDNMQNSTLQVAASCGHAGIVSLLLDHGADPDCIDMEGRTVLSIAAAQGSQEIVSDLLDRSLDEMHRDNNGWIPLHHAAFEGNTQACHLLCERCFASVEQTDREGRHPLILAAEEGHNETVKVLLEFNAPINQPTLDGCTALRLAALNGHQKVCQTLTSYGADTETRDLDGTSVLYALILQKDLEMAESLLRSGCRTDTTDAQGRVPLHVAAWEGDTGAVDLLLRFGADINARDADGRTPLMIGLWRNKLAVVKSLLEMKADVEAVCLQGATALSLACQEGQEETVLTLLRHGADPEHVDAYGRTAVDVAAKAGHKRIVGLMERMNSLSPLSPRRLMNTGNSGGSSEKTSGFISLMSSTESQYANGEQSRKKLVATGMNFATVFHPNSSFSTQSSSYCRSDNYGGSSSNKSTLSSCGTPEEDFAKQLLERSLPRPHSRPLSMRLTATEIPLSLSAHEDMNHSALEQSHSSGGTFDSLSIGSRKRPGIATNPKCRKPKNPILYAQIPAETPSDLQSTTAKFQNLMRLSSGEEEMSVL